MHPLALLLLALLLQMAHQCNFTHYTFQEWKALYGIAYTNSSDEARREALFNAKVAELEKYPDEGCGLTKFAADTPQQISDRTNLLLPPGIQNLAEKQKQEEGLIKVSTTTGPVLLKLGAPASLDWRDQGAITSVKAQGSCGTCWSFATVAMCESSLVLQGKAFNNRIYSPNLSEQFLLKCTRGSSCNGGYLENSIDKAIEKGLPYESEYPYDPYGPNNNGICSSSDLIPISNSTRVSKYYTSDDVIINMLVNGPVAIAVSAVGWENYNSGTYKCPPSSPINHAVLLVGYTSDYWIIKNSWGTNWGQNGYIYVTRNSLYNCGIGTAVHSLSATGVQLWTILLLAAIAFFII